MPELLFSPIVLLYLVTVDNFLLQTNFFVNKHTHFISYLNNIHHFQTLCKAISPHFITTENFFDQQRLMIKPTGLASLLSFTYYNIQIESLGPFIILISLLQTFGYVYLSSFLTYKLLKRKVVS